MNRPPLAVLSDLDEALQTAPADDLPVLLAALNTRAGALIARMMMQPTEGAAAGATDENLGAHETAARLGVSAAWVYKNASKLPFCVKIGRRVLFSASGLERWNKTRQGR